MHLSFFCEYTDRYTLAFLSLRKSGEHFICIYCYNYAKKTMALHILVYEGKQDKTCENMYTELYCWTHTSA